VLVIAPLPIPENLWVSRICPGALRKLLCYSPLEESSFVFGTLTEDSTQSSHRFISFEFYRRDPAAKVSNGLLGEGCRLKVEFLPTCACNTRRRWAASFGRWATPEINRRSEPTDYFGESRGESVHISVMTPRVGVANELPEEHLRQVRNPGLTGVGLVRHQSKFLTHQRIVSKP
jgi:hypothetical protein